MKWVQNKVLDLDRILNLYYRYGVKNLTMDEVAQELGISKRTLYQQVSTKNELVELVLNEEFLKFRETMLAAVEKDKGGIRKLFRLYELMSDYFRPLTPVFIYSLTKMSPLLAADLRNRYNAFIVEVLSQIVEEGKDEGVFLARFKNDFALLVAEYLFQTDNGEFCNYTQNLDMINVFYLQISGVCSDKGRKILESFIENPKLLTA